MTDWQPGPMMLTEQNIVEIIGYKTARKQREIMLKWGLPFRVRNDGTVMTTWDAINNALQGPQHRRPNLAALEKGIIVENFIDSDIRAKAATDTDLAHARMLLGHADERTTRSHYRRKPERVKPIKSALAAFWVESLHDIRD